MSQENVEIVRSAYAAVNEGDLEALAEVTARDAILDWSRSIGPQKGIYRGHDAFAQYVAALTEAFERFQLSPVDVVVAPGGEIVVRHHVSARGRASGLEIDRVPDVGARLGIARRQGHQDDAVPAPHPGPRSRRAAGVGDDLLDAAAELYTRHYRVVGLATVDVGISIATVNGDSMP
jgi:ketosteroid isomerase-like protein